MRFPLFRMLFVVSALIACNGEQFRSSGDGIKAKTESIQIACNPETGISSFSSSVSGVGATEAVITGEFCARNIAPPEVDDMNIMFVLDTSGSMTQGASAADPGDGITCGRLQAGDVIVQNIEQQLNSAGLAAGQVRAGVKIGIAQFDSNARVVMPLTDLTPGSQAGARSGINYNNFCSPTNGATNYQAAFDEASRALQSATGQKIIYFISDGAPTRPTAQTGRTAGMQALENLRAANPGVDVNIVYLASGGAASADQQSYLLQLVRNDASKLKFANNAAELAATIQTFELPKPPSISGDQRSVLGTLSAPGYGEREIPVRFIEGQGLVNGAVVWKFTSEKFPFFGAKGQTVTNTFVVRARTTDGQEPEAIATVNYSRR